MTPVLQRTILFVFAASVVGSFGAVFLKMGAGRLGGSLLHFLNSRLAIGIALYVGSSVFYAFGIREGQLSVAYPMVSLGFVWTLFLSRMFFGESLTRQKIMGVGLILLGVFFVGAGSL